MMVLSKSRKEVSTLTNSSVILDKLVKSVMAAFLGKDKKLSTGTLTVFTLATRVLSADRTASYMLK